MAGKQKRATFTFDDVKAAVESRKTEASALNTLGKVLALIGWKGKVDANEGSDGYGKVRVYVFHNVGGIRALLLIAGPGLAPKLEIASKEIPKGVFIESRGDSARSSKAAASVRSGKRGARAVTAAVRDAVEQAVEAEAILHEEAGPGAMYPRRPKHRHAVGKARGPAYGRASMPGRKHSMSAWKAAHAPPPPPVDPRAEKLAALAAKLAKARQIAGQS